MAVSIDIGTSTVVAARQEGKKVVCKHERNAFIYLGPWAEVKNKLKRARTIPYVNIDGEVYIVGTAAYDYANIFGDVELHRPMSLGMLNPKEKNALPIMKELLGNLLGKPQKENEVCVFVTPSEPIDIQAHTIYHEDVTKSIIESLGYKAVNLKESIALAYEGLADDDLTGISCSCLTPGQKIITKRGFVDIDKIVSGDEVLTKEGNWEACVPTSREYTGDVYEIWSYGGGKIEVTEDHKLWVCREGQWQWFRAKDLKVGDLTKQPTRNYDFGTCPVINYTDRVTCSLETKKITKSLSGHLAELIGYFLGDGCLEQNDKCCNFTFNRKEDYNIKRIKFLAKDVFDKEASENSHGDNDVRMKFYHTGFCDWLRRRCYDFKTKEKVVPWDLSRFSDNQLRYLLRGLFFSDGTHIEGTEVLSFSNSSPDLAQFVYLALHRLGISASYNCRPPRGLGGFIKGRQIEGKKENYTITSSSFEARALMAWMRDPCRTASNSYIYSCSVSRIGTIEKKQYKGKVYDVSVSGEDHSFCVPGIAVHNCGAGMLNVSVVMRGLTALDFSVTKSGDYIDQQAARETDRPVAHITSIKESDTFSLNPIKPRDTREEIALVSYYRFVIKNALTQIAHLFNSSKGMPVFREPVKIVCGGGTSMADGFIELFEDEYKKLNFPIKVKSIELVPEPFYAVARGALSEAIIVEEDLTDQ